MLHATFGPADLSAFCCLDELGLVATGQRIEPHRVVIEYRVIEPDGWCSRCGAEGVPRGTVVRRLAHVPFGMRPTILLVRVRRYRCTGCGHLWRQDTTSADEPRSKLSRGALGWALTALVVDHLTIARVRAAFDAHEEHVAVEVTWSVYQRIVASYRDPDRHRGKRELQTVIASLRRDVPAGLTELRTLGRTLHRRATDVLAYFDLPGTSNGPTEAINGRLEHLRGSALGFRNPTNYIARSLLGTGGFRPLLHARLR